MRRELPLIILIFLIFQSAIAAEQEALSEPFASAEAETTSDAAKFGGEGSFGWVINRGNTNNESSNGSLNISYKKNAWLHDFTITAKRVSENDVITAERYLFTEKSDYSFSKHSFAFISYRYDDDRFDGFEFQSSISLGIGWRLLDSETRHFDLELGAGYRENELVNIGTKNSESILRFSQTYDVKLTETTEFKQDLLAEYGDTNTASEFTAALKVSMNSKLALQLSYNIKHNSDPPAGSEPTDRTSAITLVYGF